MGKFLIAPVVLIIGYSYPAQAGYSDLGVNLKSSSYLGDKSWYVTSSSYLADMTIRLSGDIQEWYEHANQKITK